MTVFQIVLLVMMASFVKDGLGQNVKELDSVHQGYDFGSDKTLTQQSQRQSDLKHYDRRETSEHRSGKLVEKITMLADQETNLADRKINLAGQETKLAGQETKLADRKIKLAGQEGQLSKRVKSKRKGSRNYKRIGLKYPLWYVSVDYREWGDYY